MELQTVLVSATVAGKYCYIFSRPIPFTFVNEDLPAAVTAELSNTDVVSVWVTNFGPQAILVRVENTLGILTIESEIEVQRRVVHPPTQPALPDRQQPNKDYKFKLQHAMRMTVSEAPKLQTEFTHLRFVRLSAQRWRCETIKDSIPLGEAKFFHKDWCFSSYTSTDWHLDDLKIWPRKSSTGSRNYLRGSLRRRRRHDYKSQLQFCSLAR